MDDLKLIKKHYGEKMAHLCRDLFPTVLETPGVLYTVLSKTFYPTKFLYDDLYNDSLKEAFKEVVSYAIPNKEELEKKVVLKSAKELLDEAGYTLYECKNEEDIQSFRHYYQRNDGIVPKYTPGTNPKLYNGEELCTFNGDRLDSCHVFFAVKKNADKIKREDFRGKEDRQDEYGTSVISIQFSRGINNVLSIKNRYNHTVSNPDATFSNNLENIISGLTQAFERDYSLNIKENKSKRGIPGYVLAEDGKFYKYNIEECNVYFCPDNIIIDHSGVKHYDKSRYIVFDTFILDLKNKTMKPYSYSFRDSFKDHYSEIKDIKVEVDKKTKHKKIYIDKGMMMILSPTNEMIYYRDTNIKETYSHFLCTNKKLKGVFLPNVTTVDEGFLMSNENLKYLNLPNCEIIEYAVLINNKELERLNLPKVKRIHDDFLRNNKKLKALNLPNCRGIGSNCFQNNTDLEKLILPKAEFIGKSLFTENEKINELYMPNCEIIASGFLKRNLGLEEIDLPKVKYIEHEFLTKNRNIIRVNLPSVERIESSVLNSTTEVEEVYMPKVFHIGEKFLMNAKKLKTLSLPSLLTMESYCLTGAVSLESIDMPKCMEICNCFVVENKVLSNINIPNCIQIGDFFLKNNQGLKSIDLASTISIGNSFMPNNKILESINIPNCETLGNHFLEKNTELKTEILELPRIKNIGYDVLTNNNRIKIVRLANCTRINDNFLYNNEVLEEFDAPKVEILADSILHSNTSLKVLNIPNLIRFGEHDYNSNVSFYSQLPKHPLRLVKRKEGAKTWMI